MSLSTYLLYLKRQGHNLHQATLLASDRYGCAPSQVSAIWRTLPGPDGGAWR